MALKEADLVLAWRIYVSPLHTEMIVYSTTVGRSGSLENEICSCDLLTILEQRTIESDLDTLSDACIGRIVVCGIEVGIASHILGDVVIELELYCKTTKIVLKT